MYIVPYMIAICYAVRFSANFVHTVFRLFAARGCEDNLRCLECGENVGGGVGAGEGR